MRKLVVATIPLLLVAAMAMAQTSSNDQSTTEKAKGAASSVGSAVKKGAETGYDKTKEGAQKVYGKAKGAVTGSNEQNTEANQTSTEGTSTTASGRLPHTASPLPLIGLLGLGAFSLGALRIRLFRG
jgi:cobalamin biosynthesis Mg chelatase CobN